MEKENLPDHKNPKYLFQSIDTSLLVKAVNKHIDLLELAKAELRSRGLNKKGVWVGFDKSSK